MQRRGNPFGLAEALLGLAGGFVLSFLGISVYDSLEHLSATQVTVGETVISLICLWIGLAGAAVLASRLRLPGRELAASGEGGPDSSALSGAGSLVEDYGLRLNPWPDIPLGIAIGVASQFLLVPLLELPLQPFVPHLTQRLGHPTRQLLGPATTSGTGGLVLIAVLVCLGSPVIEELFFRGLVLRALLWRLGPLGRRLGPGLSILATGLVFALVHFEALQFLALAGFGVVLGVLAWRTERLGPCIVAHMAFNTSTVIAYVITR